MPRCIATTKSGRRCLNRAKGNDDHCASHLDQVSAEEAKYLLAGAALGHIFLPGIGGIVGGALTGAALKKLLKENKMAKKRVFVSFDFDNDRALKDFLVGQAKLPNSPFEVIDHSLKEAAPELNWEAHALAAIKRAEIVLVIAGTRTYQAPGVRKEIAMAREQGIPIVQITGHSDKPCPSVPDAGRKYSWTWDNLKNLLG